MTKNDGVPAKPQERAAVSHLIVAIRMAKGREYDIGSEGGDDFPEYKLTERSSGLEQRVEVVEAVESGAIRAAESQAERVYPRARQECLARNEEVILVASDRGIEEVVPAPGYGVTGVSTGSDARKIWPED